MLLEIGFLKAHVNDRLPDERVFLEAISYAVIKRDGGPFGKWFNAFRMDCGIDNPKLDYHEFRTTVSNRLINLKVTDTYIEEIVGHESDQRDTALDEYGRGRALGLLREALSLYQPPMGILAARCVRFDA